MLQSPADPYKSVFEIRDEQRPPHPYALLHLPDFEMNREKIKRAADRARYRLDSHRESLDQPIWLKLQGELENAVDTLLKVDRKALLDASIRRRTSALIEPPESNGAEHRCPKCDTANGGKSQFCQQCGLPQWIRCVACKTICHASQAFCNDCGVNLKEADDRANSELRGDLERAVGLAKGYDFDRAVALLRQVALVEDSRFQAVCDKALEWIDKVYQFKEKAAATDEDIVEKAGQLIEARKYADAAKIIEAHPEKLRSAELNNLLAESGRRRDELEQIRREIASAIQKKQLEGLASKIERLHDVSPDPNEAAQLEKQLAARFLGLAKKCLESHQYESATRLLNDIPKKYRNKAVRAMEDEAAEFGCLADQVRRSAAVTPTTQAMAKKLLASSDESQAIAKLAKQIASAKTIPTTPYDAYPMLGDNGDDNRLGKPIRWFGRCQRLECSALANKSMRNAPGVWYGAIGLALQAMGDATVNLNLQPSRGFLSGLMGGKAKKVNEAWGIDFGNDSVKAVRMVRQPDGAPMIEEAELVTHTDALNRPHSETELEAIIQTAVDKLHEKVGVNTPVCIGLPPTRVLARFLQLPPGANRKDADVLAYEARSQFPMSLDELYWSYHIFDHGSEFACRDAMLVAARKSAADEITKPMVAKKWKINCIQSSSLGVHNFFLADYFDGAKESTLDEPPVAILDIGASMSTLMVSSPVRLWQVGVHLGGVHFTNAMTGPHGLTFAQAEELKQKPWLAKRFHRLLETWEPVYTQLEGEIQRSLSAYEKQFPDTIPYSTIIGLGGGFAQHGLYAYLRRSR